MEKHFTVNKEKLLIDLFDEIKSCDSCCSANFGKLGRRIGNFDASIMVISDWSEMVLNYNKVFNRCGITIDNAYHTKSIKCDLGSYPAANKFVKKCFHFLETEIAIVNPKVIITLGEVATMALTKNKAMTKVHGNVYKYKGIFVVPTYELNKIMKNTKIINIIIKDIEVAKSLVDVKPVKKHYIICSAEKEALDCLEDLQKNATVYSCDLECVTKDSWFIEPLTGDFIEIKDYIRDKITTYNYNTNKFNYSSDTNLVYKGKKDLKKITTRFGNVIKASNNHYILIKRSYKKYTVGKGKGTTNWVKVSDIKLNDYIASPSLLPHKSGGSNLTNNEIKLLAYFVTNGVRIGDLKKGMTCKISTTNKDAINELDDIAKDFNCGLKMYGNNVINICTKKPGIRNLAGRFIYDHGLLEKYSYEKFIPPIIFKSSFRQIALFLNRLIFCDGHIIHNNGKRSGVGYSTTSKKLVYQLQHLLLRFGISCAICHHHDNRKESYKTLYYITISGEDACLFKDIIGSFSHKEKIFEKWNKKYRGKFKENGLLWCRVVKIKDIGKQDVYDITVPKTHNILLNNIVHHNTTGLHFVNHVIRSMQFSYKKHHAFYIPIELIKDKILKLIKIILTDQNKISIFQNGKFDMLFIMYHLKFKPTNFLFDIMLLMYLIDVNARRNLDSMSAIFPDLAGYSDELNKFLPKTKKEGRDYSKVPMEILAPYGMADAEVTRRLFPIFYEKIVNLGLLDFYQTVVHPLQNILCDMEFKGIDIDVKHLGKLSKEFYLKVIGSKKAVQIYAGKELNLNSPDQVSEFLFKKLKLKPIKKTPEGKNSTDAEVLRKLYLQGNTAAQFLFDYRKYDKRRSTFIKGAAKAIAKDGKIHANYNITATRTLRLSSDKPNLQNQPRKGRIREMFIPPKNHSFIICDYSQIELRILTFFSRDPLMLKIYREGLDIHAMTGLELFGKEDLTVEERVASKTTNFGIIYGIYYVALAKKINDAYMDEGIEDQDKFVTEKDAEKFIIKWFNKYKGARRWIEDEKKRLFNQGYAENFFGVRRELIKLYSTEKRERAEALREGISTIIQGTAACYVNKAIVDTIANMKRDGLGEIYPTLPVHDEITFVAPNLGNEFLENVAQYISKSLTTNIVPEIEKVVNITVDYKITDKWGK